MTIHQAYHQMQSHLNKIYDTREAANISNMLIEKVTGQKKIDRIIYKDLPVDADQQKKLEEMTNELLHHKPVQYVLHESWFYGMPFFVNEHVLIPRPETEELVEWVIVDLHSKFKIQNSKFKIIDIGTGSGCIAVAIKKQIPEAFVTAIDVSAEALSVAAINAANQQTEIDFKQLDFLNSGSWNLLDKYDVIVSNPPYIKQSEEEQMNRNVLAFEPHLALFVPDENALIFYEAIASFAKEHLTTDGTIYMEINEALGQKVVDLFKAEGYKDVAIKKDMQGKDRMVRVSNKSKVVSNKS